MRHLQEVFLKQLIFFRLRVETFHASQQGGVYPAVATTPVAVVAVFFLIGWHVVLVAPPQSVLLVEETATTCVAAPLVAADGVVETGALARELVISDIDRHGHLYGVDPGPVVAASGGHLMVEVGFHLFDHLAVFHHGVALQVGLCTALVVSVGGHDAVARCPLVEVGPAVSIVKILLQRVDGVERHESLVVDGARPQRAGPLLFHECGACGIGVDRHEAVVDATRQCQNAVRSVACVAGQDAHETENQWKEDSFHWLYLRYCANGLLIAFRPFASALMLVRAPSREVWVWS